MSNYKNCGVKSTVDLTQTAAITANKHAERVRRDGGTRLKIVIKKERGKKRR